MRYIIIKYDKKRRNIAVKKYKMITYADRIKIEVLYNKGYKPKEIAEDIDASLSNIYKELKAGIYYKRKGDREVKSYSAYIAEEKHNFNKSNRGPGLKIANDINLANFIEKQICDEKLSPEAVLLKIKRNPQKYKFNVTIKSNNTIYSYIDKKIFLNLERKHLPVARKKKTKRKSIVIHRKPPEGYSIEKRDECVDIKERIEFGHFEGDTVVSGGGDKSAILVLTERKTRFPIFLKLKRNTTEEVARAFDRLERSFGGSFYKIFKSITFDNGSEFKGYEGIEKAKRRKGIRFKIYYAHPYSPHERGSNENNNRFIRRWFPKGTKFKDVLNKRIFELQQWVSEYPRKMFDGRSSKDLFLDELINLNINFSKLAI